MTPFVNVVVATYGRQDCLLAALEDLRGQDYPEFDVVVVDQNVEASEALERLVRESAPRICRIPLSPPNLPAARNRGIVAGRGEIVLFVDDDVRCAPSLISEHAAMYSSPDVGGVGGWIDARSDDKVWRPERDFVDSPIGCNMSFRREALERAGGFDPHFTGAATGEEIDLACRVRRAGYRIAVAPKAMLFHDVESIGGCRADQAAPDAYWDDYIANQTLKFLKTSSRVRRTLLLPWAVRLWRTTAALRGRGIVLGRFVAGVLRGRRSYRGSRRVETFLSRGS